MNRNELKAVVLARVKEVVELAREKYNMPVEFADLEITFPVKGKHSLATAWWQSDRWGMRYGMTFKIEAIEQQLDDCLNDSIPHEVAHLVCMARNLNNHHNAEWKEVCIGLGGSGNRTAKGIEVVLTPAKVQKKYVYVASCGTELELSAKIHNQVQRGQVRTLRRTKGRIDSTCFVRVIGKQEILDDVKRRQKELAERQGRKVAEPVAEEKAPTPPPVRRAARSTGGKQTKAAMVRSYLSRNKFSCSAEAIECLMQQFDMSKQMSSTYYYKYR